MDKPPASRRIALPGRLESLPALSDFIASAVDGFGIDAENAYRLQLAVEEAFINVIQHGVSGPQADPLDITVEVSRTASGFAAILRDQGHPFDPTTLPLPDLRPQLHKRRPGGLGVYLMRRLMDEVTYEVREGVNTLTLARRLP
jgi:anti-sigma regulatory factor (Ser/Thr protein kinase)